MYQRRIMENKFNRHITNKQGYRTKSVAILVPKIGK